MQQVTLADGRVYDIDEEGVGGRLDVFINEEVYQFEFSPFLVADIPMCHGNGFVPCAEAFSGGLAGAFYQAYKTLIYPHGRPVLTPHPAP